MIAEINPGTLINNRYLIQKILGQGGFGRTYLAFDNQRFGEACVLKEFVPATNNTNVIRKSQELFEREAKVLHQIQHPQIPKFLAWLTENQRLFIVQEYIDGKTYAQILSERCTQKGKAFSETEVKKWLLDILPVLEYIHERKIIHRDISLENVMQRSEQSKPVLIDFGIVKEKFTQILSAEEENQQYAVKGSVVGKIGYSPPEQLRLGHCYPSSDIYALGVSAVILLTGKMPHMLIDDSLNWQWHSHVNISNDFGCILEKMLEEVPTERYQSATEVILKLDNKQNNSYQPQVSVGGSKRLSFGGIIANLLPKTQNKTNTQEQEKQKAISNAVTNQNLDDDLILGQQAQKPSSESETNNQLYSQTPVSLNPLFFEYCQRELTSFVGPFASVLMEHTLEENPQIAPKEFVEVLVEAIPDAQLAIKFRNHIQLPPESLSAKLQGVSTPELMASYPAISNPDFLDNCRRELTSFVGPFASVIIRDTLDQKPHLTPKQLIETLVAEIPSPQKAQEFKQRMNK
jgi:serine/threonine protein kinase